MSTKQIYDVFLSYAQADIAWAAEVEQRFIEQGCRVYNIAHTAAGEHVFDSVHEALAESDALVLLVNSASGLQTSSLSFEVGAAMAWDKPVYVLHKGERPKNLPSYLDRFESFPANRLQQFIEKVQESSSKLDFAQRERLATLYRSFDMPVDEFLLSPSKASQLARKFNKATGMNRTGESLIRELLRLRKQGLHVRSATRARAAV